MSRKAHGNKNSFQIDFFYLNVEYECRATDFLRPAFKEFPFAEYAYIRLPHSIPDHALLSKFQYVPLKQGLTLKQGCFVVCRYILDDLEVSLPCLRVRTRCPLSAARALGSAVWPPTDLHTNLSNAVPCPKSINAPFGVFFFGSGKCLPKSFNVPFWRPPSFNSSRTAAAAVLAICSQEVPNVPGSPPMHPF